MPYDLLTYFEKRFNRPEKQTKGSVPFITISRETGCGANELALQIIRALKRRGIEWKYINKEVLEESAKKLKLEESKIEYVFNTEEKTHIDEILFALSNKHYKSDRMVRKTISGVLRHFALEGNMIIVGRAGVATTSDLPGGLHIRLTAPFAWRVNAMKKRKTTAGRDVAAYVRKQDDHKRKLIEVFSGKKIEDVQLDLSFNCARFSKVQIASLVVAAMAFRKMIPPEK